MQHIHILTFALHRLAYCVDNLRWFKIVRTKYLVAEDFQKNKINVLSINESEIMR